MTLGNDRLNKATPFKSCNGISKFTEKSPGVPYDLSFDLLSRCLVFDIRF